MSTQKQPGIHARTQFRAAFNKLKNGRSYALDEASETAFGALAEAWRQSKGLSELSVSDLADLIERLLPFDFLELLQQRAVEPEKLTWPVDEVTGEKLPNPWAEGGNLSDRNAVHKLDPRLAHYFERLAKEGAWKLYAERLQESAERAELNAIRYDAEAHKKNVFRTDDVAAQSEFVKANSPEFPTEGLKVAFYRREARPITAPWSASTINRTHLGKIVQSDPELGNLCTRAQQIEQQWLEQARQIAKAEEAEAKAHLEAIQKRLGVGPTPDEQDARARLAHEAAMRR